MNRILILFIAVITLTSTIANAQIEPPKIRGPYILVYTLGEVAPHWIDFTSGILIAGFGYRAALRGDLPIIKKYGPFLTGAYKASKILDTLEKIALESDARVIALTELKLARSEGTSLGGLARSSAGVTVVSTYGIDKNDADETTTKMRFAKRILHEFGHASGLHHCRQDLCVMSFDSNVEHSDAKSFILCPRCATLLEDNTDISYKIAKAYTELVLDKWGVIDFPGDPRTIQPQTPDDLSYDKSGTGKTSIVVDSD